MTDGANIALPPKSTAGAGLKEKSRERVGVAQAAAS
jgi:hypothetical protein